MSVIPSPQTDIYWYGVAGVTVPLIADGSEHTLSSLFAAHSPAIVPVTNSTLQRARGVSPAFDWNTFSGKGRFLLNVQLQISRPTIDDPDVNLCTQAQSGTTNIMNYAPLVSTDSVKVDSGQLQCGPGTWCFSSRSFIENTDTLIRIVKDVTARVGATFGAALAVNNTTTVIMPETTQSEAGDLSFSVPDGQYGWIDSAVIEYITGNPSTDFILNQASGQLVRETESFLGPTTGDTALSLNVSSKKGAISSSEVVVEVGDLVCPDGSDRSFSFFVPAYTKDGSFDITYVSHSACEINHLYLTWYRIRDY